MLLYATNIIAHGGRRIKRIIVILLMCIMIGIQPVMADVRDNVRQEGLQFAKPLETIMVDGPMFVDGSAFYVAGYIESDSRVAASLVFDVSSSTFISDGVTMRKVLATKDLKRLTVADPLFHGVGDTKEIIIASKYETQNVRNFASFSSLSQVERNLLDIFLNDYEEVMADVANVSILTQNILYPEDALEIVYRVSPPGIDVQTKDGFAGGRFSYEGFEELVSSYEDLYTDYSKLSSDLIAWAGGLKEYPPGTIIREKWEVEITKEGILEEVMLIEENGAQLKRDIDLREDVLLYPYEEQISEAQKRLGVKTPLPSKGVISTITGALVKIKKLIFGLFGLGALLLFSRKKSPFYILILVTMLLSIFSPSLSYGTTSGDIPTMNELISQKVELGETIPYSNLALNLSNSTIEELLFGFRLVLKGETVEVRGPYTYDGRPYYFVDVKREGVSTGNGFLVDAEKFRLVGDQRQAFQLLKTLVFADLLEKRSLYKGVEHELIEQQADATLQSPLDMFLANLSLNVKEGTVLEKSLVENPGFETLLDLTGHYVEAYVLIQNINQLVSQEEAERLTAGFSNKLFLLDAYSRAIRGLSTQEYLWGRIAQYRGRTLNRLPLIRQLSLMGLRPSKAQVAHDLTSDLIYDNIYLWRKGRITNPNIFARLAFREGTYTLPKVAANFTVNSSS